MKNQFPFSLHSYIIEKELFFKLVINICPGVWVIIIFGFDSIATTWGVTPHAQNTGISPRSILTASPKSGLLI